MEASQNHATDSGSRLLPSGEQSNRVAVSQFTVEQSLPNQRRHNFTVDVGQTKITTGVTVG